MAAVNALNAYFAPKVNLAYARHTFRQLQQSADETVLQFASRLKRYAKDCDYGTDTDNQIRDEILHKCKSDYVRRKLLEECLGLTLARTLELAQQCEKVEAQMTSLSLHSTDQHSNDEHRINKITSATNNRDQRYGTRVGLARHQRRDVYAMDVAIPATMVVIQFAQLEVRPTATVVASITLLPFR